MLIDEYKRFMKWSKTVADPLILKAFERCGYDISTFEIEDFDRIEITRVPNRFIFIEIYSIDYIDLFCVKKYEGDPICTRIEYASVGQPLDTAISMKVDLDKIDISRELKMLFGGDLND